MKRKKEVNTETQEKKDVRPEAKREEEVKPVAPRKRQLVSFDWAVKRLLRDKVNFEVVEGFLSELLRREISITNVLESESNKTDANDKQTRIDIVVEDTKGEIILIELQFMREMDFFQRMLYGVSKTIVEHMVQGDKYMELKKVYSVNILYFDLAGKKDDKDKDNDKNKDYVYYGNTQFTGMHSKEKLYLTTEQQNAFGQIKVGDLYPVYYIISVKNFDNVAKTTLDEWIYFLKNDRIEEGFSAKGLLKAREVLDYNRLSQEDRAKFDYEQSIKSHELSQISTVKDIAEEKYRPIIAEKDKEIEENKKEIEEKDKTIEEKDKTIEEKDKALAENKKTFEENKKEIARQAQEIEELRRLLNK